MMYIKNQIHQCSDFPFHSYSNPTPDAFACWWRTFGVTWDIHTLIKERKKWRPRRHSPNQPRTQES